MSSAVHSTQEYDMDTRSLSSSHRHPQDAPYVHKVGLPPKQNLFKEFKATVKETFFADDPLRSFKDQPRSKKFILGLQAIFPILEWGRSYSFAKFRGDLIAGLTIASLCIPQVDYLLKRCIRNRNIMYSPLCTVSNSLHFGIKIGYWVCKACKFGSSVRIV
jgi:hypothetical protein